MLSVMSRHVGDSEQGQLQGANASMMGIASLIGPGIFTQAFAFSIGANAIIHLPGAPFLLAAIMIAASLAVAAYTMHTTKVEQPI
jgi:DHA1 family tetracycline resistance protein-like MFS transporter